MSLIINNLDKSELKAIIKEVIQEDPSMMKAILKEILLENEVFVSKEQKRQERIESIINNDFEQYDEVFKVLA